jgi:uncharacterized protein YprB with RNaseH-like and TPR domain
MLTNTFCHMPRISLSKEQALWGQGILTWNDYRSVATQLTHLEESEKQFQNRDPRYFSSLLGSDQSWRLFKEFRSCTAYLDIETTGLSRDYDEITTIALYDGKNLNTYVNGRNLGRFPEDIRKYDMIVTFNGKTFDVPFIKRYFDIEMDHAHIDLRYVMRKLGYRGGLKAIEKSIGIDRGELDGVDGFLGVLLWKHYKRTGEERALDTLLAYNCEDVVNLEHLMVMAYNLNLKLTPFKGREEITLPERFSIPFEADANLIRKLAWS